ncbi:MAG: hypothetical protein JWP03_372 [Phycisphaerales bacterium]|nr:hypothetical protein [Phycisphaerales bacterium]
MARFSMFRSKSQSMLRSKSEAPTIVDKVGGRALGFASIGIGLAELTMPEKIEQWLGIGRGQHSNILRVLGARELMHGADILTHRDPTPGVWSRVAGDALDGALFAAVARKTRRPSGYATAALLLLGITVADVVFAKRLSRRRRELEYAGR